MTHCHLGLDNNAKPGTLSVDVSWNPWRDLQQARLYLRMRAPRNKIEMARVMPPSSTAIASLRDFSNLFVNLVEKNRQEECHKAKQDMFDTCVTLNSVPINVFAASGDLEKRSHKGPSHCWGATNRD